MATQAIPRCFARLTLNQAAWHLADGNETSAVLCLKKAIWQHLLAIAESIECEADKPTPEEQQCPIELFGVLQMAGVPVDTTLAVALVACEQFISFEWIDVAIDIAIEDVGKLIDAAPWGVAAKGGAV